MFSRVTFIAFLLTVFLLGCAHQVRDFEFKNRSASLINAEIYGFEDNPPVGDMYPAGGKGATMHFMPIPQQVMIAWNEEPYKNPKQGFVNMDTISLTSLTNWSSDVTLVFEFGSNHVWRVFYKR